MILDLLLLLRLRVGMMSSVCNGTRRALMPAHVFSVGSGLRHLLERSTDHGLDVGDATIPQRDPRLDARHGGAGGLLPPLVLVVDDPLEHAPCRRAVVLAINFDVALEVELERRDGGV